MQSYLKKLSIEVDLFEYLGNASEYEMKRTLQTSEEDQKHLKSNLEGVIAAVQIENDLMASEMRSLTLKNIALSIELQFLKYQLNVLKVAEHSLKQQNETLQEEANSTNCLLNEQVEDLNERFREFHETNVKLFQEKMELESLLAEAARKYRELEENHCKSLKKSE